MAVAAIAASAVAGSLATEQGVLGDPAGSADAQFLCAACSDSFASAAEFRVHSKTERHVYNTKRKLSGLRPISQELWDKKLREARAAVSSQNKGTAHLKSGKEKKASRREGSDAADAVDNATAATEESTPTIESATAGADATYLPSPRRSLFDKRHFEEIDTCLSYMEKKYSFFIPDREYCTDVAGLLLYLRKKMEEPPHQCIACNRPFPDVASVRRHMFDKCHTHIGSEVHTRRGLADHAGTERMQAELEEFFDYNRSVLEITERFKTPQKVASLFRYFDTDGDGRLQFSELAALWAAASGNELSEAQYLGACSIAEAEPTEGLDSAGLARLYAADLANLDAHFAMLQEKLVAPRAKKVGKSAETLESVTEGEEAKEEAANTEEELDDDTEEGSGDDDDEDDDSVEVLECEDEDEFAEIMRVLGLVQVDITDTGDLKLPFGGCAAPRSVAYIFKQRGRRLDPEQRLALARGNKALGDHRTHLMLSNIAAGTKVAVSERCAKRDGKRVLAMLKQRNWQDTKLGIKNNLLQTNRIMSSRSVRGDMSGSGGGGR